VFRRRRRAVGTTTATQPAIAGYRDLQLIGSGGFSKVYTAYQERFARTVAVKVITVELSDDARRRFQREQLTAGQLDGHPHVIRVYESGTTDDGMPYLTMEHHEQGSLADRVRRTGPLPVGEVLDVGVKLACALDAAHRRGIVHRDVKPQNVLVSPFVGPILADFGIAAFDDARMQTVTSEAFSVFHVAPEVLDGHPATPAADLYALASTLYELLSGRAPFAADGPPGAPGGAGEGLLQYMRRVRTATVPPIDRPDVPPGLVEELVALMARDPGERPASGLALAERLRALQAELGTPVTPLVGDGSEAVTPPPGDVTLDPPPGPPGGVPVRPLPLPDPGPTPDMRTPEAPRPDVPGPGLRPPGARPPAASLHPGPSPPAGPAAPSRPVAGVGGGFGDGLEDEAPPTATFRRPPSRPAPPSTGDGGRRRRWLVLGGAGGGLVLLVTGAWLVLGGDSGGDPGGGTPRRRATTSTTDGQAAALPPCPGAGEPSLPDVPIPGGDPPSRLEVEVSGDGTAATVRWDDPNAGRNPYLVFASCDAPDTGDRQLVATVAAGEATEVTVEGLSLEHNYCFTVAVLHPGGPGGNVTQYTAEDGTHFRCLDQTAR
jgi:serine/threonine-protein kinase PknK